MTHVEADYRYDAAGQRTRVWSRNQTESLTAYERVDWLQSIENKKFDGTLISYFGYERFDGHARFKARLLS